tara:strand:+ start:128 stop:472 length:345 start_codon:yes stop_codon:yes gene_type:complete
MFESSVKKLETLNTVSLNHLLDKHDKYACICKANMCGACLAFEQSGALRKMEDSLTRSGIPYSVRECRNDPHNHALLMSTGTSQVPCVVYISNHSFQVKTVDEFQKFLDAKRES